MPKYAMAFDANRCIGCQSCSIACREENRVPEGVSRLQVWIESRGSYPNPSVEFHRQSCVMCESPPCVPVCPTGASYINEDGVTLVDADRCVGCKYCILACPYDARFINPVTRAADKCTFCYSNRVSQGLLPACVAQCPTGALAFGDLEDPDSDVHKALKGKYYVVPKEHLGTDPKMVIIPGKGAQR